jgi:hypothetical protein
MHVRNAQGHPWRQIHERGGRIVGKVDFNPYMLHDRIGGACLDLIATMILAKFDFPYYQNAARIGIRTFVSYRYNAV